MTLNEGKTTVLMVRGANVPCVQVLDLFLSSQDCFVYLLHFDEPLVKKNGARVQHYLGSTEDLDRRMKQHAYKRKKTGAAIVRSLNKRGFTWSLAKVWRANRNLEHVLKRQKQSLDRYCPLCQGVPF